MRFPGSDKALAVLVAAAATMLPASAAGQSDPPPPQLIDVYPAAAKLEMAPPRLGAVPGLDPVPGQDATPRVPRNCVRSPLPQGVPGVDPRAVDPSAPNPLRGLRWYVDPMEHAFKSYASFVRRGKKNNARLMWQIARQPRFRWFGRWTRPNMKKKIREYLNCVSAVQPGAVPLMTVLRHQGKRCGPDYGAGGRAEDRRTRKWYDNFADALGDARVILAFEPDSLGTLECIAKGRRKSRLKNMRHGIDVLSRKPNVTIYIEAGASDWESAARTAAQLRYVGIRKVRGFMLNVTHYDWTGHNVRHGLEISRRVGGKPFIVSTSYNGRGPVHFKARIGGRTRRLNVWCHPLLRGRGPVPTTATGNPKVDAYMWIGRPGYSAGKCNGGPLPVGTWWPKRALMFAKHGTSWLFPRRGTRNGYSRRYGPRALGHCGARCT